MAQKCWRGRWEFRNVMHGLHGSNGTTTVQAENEDEARSKIKDGASKELFGTTMMHNYIIVSDLKPERR